MDQMVGGEDIIYVPLQISATAFDLSNGSGPGVLTQPELTPEKLSEQLKVNTVTVEVKLAYAADRSQEIHGTLSQCTNGRTSSCR